MAYTKCGSCGHSFFEMVEVLPVRSNLRKLFIQCVGCGVPAGFTDFYDTNAKIDRLEKRMIALETALDIINDNIIELAGLVKKKK